MSARAQRIMIWWGLIFMAIYGLAWVFLLHILPPPPATWSTAQVAQWYVTNATDIKWGASIAGWTSAFLVPYTIVVTAQMWRLEKGKPIWSMLAFAGGTIMSLFLTFPPIIWGTAAFTPTRAPEITATLHELGWLTMVSTDQYYIFLWVAVAVVCLLPNTVVHSPFPRWFGYFTIWNALMLEAGAIAFNAHTGPFAWNGLLVYWVPLTLFVIWLIVLSRLMFTAISEQEAAESEPLTAVAA